MQPVSVQPGRQLWPLIHPLVLLPVQLQLPAPVKRKDVPPVL
jgi:hypothetical protein